MKRMSQDEEGEKNKKLNRYSLTVVPPSVSSSKVDKCFRVVMQRVENLDDGRRKGNLAKRGKNDYGSSV